MCLFKNLNIHLNTNYFFVMENISISHFVRGLQEEIMFSFPFLY